MKEIRLTQRELQALELREAGLTFSQIADKMGVSKSRAHRLYRNAVWKLEIKRLRGENDESQM